MKPLTFVILLFSAFLLITGCTTQPEPVVTSTVEPTETILPSPEPTDSESGSETEIEPTNLKIWVPPQFDPNGDTPGGSVLQARLDEFILRRPGTTIEVRVKALSGPGGMIDTLQTTSGAAPLALPDLIALPRPLMESAAIKGLILPFDELTDSMLDEDWFPYALELSQLEQSTFGLPFAGDALAAIYRPSVTGELPVTWSGFLELQTPVIFTASDPDALTSLAFYQSTGAELLDEDRRPVIDSVKFTEVLTYFHQAQTANVLPFWITQFESEDQAWLAFEEGQSDIILTWASNYLVDTPADANAAQFPTEDGTAFTMATGWVWSLTSPNTERLALSTELAEFLSSSDFIARWNSAAGFFPTRPSAVNNWRDVPSRTLAQELLPGAVLIPQQDILSSISSPIHEAVIATLKDQVDPAAAAQAASDQLKP